MTGIWEHEGNVENTTQATGECFLHFLSVLRCLECHSVTHSLGLFIFLYHIEANKTHFFYALHSNKKWIFDQSEHVQGPIYIINNNSKAIKSSWIALSYDPFLLII